jgi:hypothetical protein
MTPCSLADRQKKFYLEDGGRDCSLYIHCREDFIPRQDACLLLIQLQIDETTDYRLDDRRIGVRFPAGVREFVLFRSVQTSFGVHPAAYSIGMANPFAKHKAAGA